MVHAGKTPSLWKAGQASKQSSVTHRSRRSSSCSLPPLLCRYGLICCCTLVCVHICLPCAEHMHQSSLWHGVISSSAPMLRLVSHRTCANVLNVWLTWLEMFFDTEHSNLLRSICFAIHHPVLLPELTGSVCQSYVGSCHTVHHWGGLRGHLVCLPAAAIPMLPCLWEIVEIFRTPPRHQSCTAV